MVNWPSTLPNKFLKDGLSESPPDVILRTEMDAGPPKMRRIATAGERKITGTQSMTVDQVEIFDAFFNDDLYGGTVRFSWVHPRTGETKEFRFVSVPKYTGVGGDLLQVQMELEIMP